MPNERIVSIGFLTEGDLQRLGSAFHRHFPIEQDDMFTDLIEKLDRIEATSIDTNLHVETGNELR